MNGPWSTLTPIGLDELNARAALATRVDRKYIVPLETVEGLVPDLREHLAILEIDGLRQFAYESVYFDTAGFDCYLAAARSRPKRFKVRIRTYLDSRMSMLEVKTRDGSDRTVKHRRPYELEDRHRLTQDGHSFVEAFVGDAVRSGALHPALINHYTRRTLVVPGAAVRVTIDSAYRCQALDCGGRAELAGGVIVETKTAGKASDVDRLLWRAGYRPLPISKYCTGLAVARGGLPSNKWHRTILRHMTVDNAAGVAVDHTTLSAPVRVARSG